MSKSKGLYMNIKEIKRKYMEFIKDEGLNPIIDNEDDIIFEFENRKYLIDFDEKDLNYIRIVCHGGFKGMDENDMLKLLKAASETNSEIKMVKVIIINTESVIFSIESLLNNIIDFKIFFIRWLMQVKDAINIFQKYLDKEFIENV